MRTLPYQYLTTVLQNYFLVVGIPLSRKCCRANCRYLKFQAKTYIKGNNLIKVVALPFGGAC